MKQISSAVNKGPSWKHSSAIIAAVAMLAVGAQRSDAASEGEEIFNGKDLTGWSGNPKLWSAKDGAIVGQTTAQEPLKMNTFLIWTNGEPSDFELHCQFRITPNNNQGFANSGIQYRSKVLDPKNWVVGGYQADMDGERNYTGIVYEERMTRGIMAVRGEKVVWDKDCQKKVVGSLGTAEELKSAIKTSDWNDYVVIARGNHLQHFINGKPMVDIVDDCEAKRAMKGVIALQLHQGPPMTVEFRNMRLQQFGAQRAEKSSDEAAGDLRQLQGAWQVTAAERSGEALKGEGITNTIVIVTGKSYRTISGNETDRGTFTIDPSKNPK